MWAELILLSSIHTFLIEFDHLFSDKILEDMQCIIITNFLDKRRMRSGTACILSQVHLWRILKDMRKVSILQKALYSSKEDNMIMFRTDHLNRNRMPHNQAYTLNISEFSYLSHNSEWSDYSYEFGIDRNPERTKWGSIDHFLRSSILTNFQNVIAIHAIDACLFITELTVWKFSIAKLWFTDPN